MKIYLSGPITGVANYRDIFAKKAQEIAKRGHTVINPANLQKSIYGELTYNEWLDMDLALLDKCDAIFLLDGWAQSKGALKELRYAVLTGMTIFDRIEDIKEANND